jgi:hypothetical protein
MSADPAAPPPNPTTSGLPVPPSSAPRVASPSRLNSPRHQGPSLTPINLASSSMVLKPLTLSITTLATLPDAPSAPIKGDEHPRPSPPLFPLSPELPRAFLSPHAELKPPPFFASAALPLRHRSCSGEHPSGTAPSGSSSSTTIGENRRALVPARRVLARHRRALLSAPPRSTVDPSRATLSTRCGPGPLDFPLENKSKKSIIPYHFVFRPLSFL